MLLASEESFLGPHSSTESQLTTLFESAPVKLAIADACHAVALTCTNLFHFLRFATNDSFVQVLSFRFDFLSIHANLDFQPSIHLDVE